MFRPKMFHLVLLIVISLLTTGCTALEKEMFEKAQLLQKWIDEEEWHKAKGELSELSKFYKQQKWKIQFIGDEREWESIEESLLALEQAIDAKDKTQAKIHLAIIRSSLISVFSF